MLDRMYIMTVNGLQEAEEDYLPEGADGEDRFEDVMYKGRWYKTEGCVDCYKHERVVLWKNFDHGQIILDIDVPFDTPSFILCKNLPRLLDAFKLLQPCLSALGIESVEE